MTLKRLLVVAAGLSFVLGVGLAALPYLLGGEFVRKSVEQAVRDATGRAFAIPGPARILLWPEASVEFDNVEISGPAPARAPFASIGTLRLGTNAFALFGGRLEVEEILLQRPIVQLTVDSAGGVNFTGAAPAEGGPPLKPLIVEDGEIRFRDARTGAAFEASDADFTVATEDGSLDVRGHLTWRQRRVAFTAYVRSPARLASEGSPADITIEAPELSAAFSGQATLKDGLSLAGQIDAASPSLGDLAAWGGFAADGVTGFNDLSIAGALDLRGLNLRAKNASLSFDGMKATGDVALLLDGTRPRLQGKLELDRLDLNVFFPNAGKGVSLTLGWRDSPIELTALRSADADLQLEVGEIAYGPMRTRQASIRAQLKDGALDAEFAALALYDGGGRGRLMLDGSAKTLDLRAAIEVEKVGMRELLRDFSGFEALSGSGKLSILLSARGASQIELVSTLTGSVHAEVLDGALENVELRRLAEAASEKPVPGWLATPGRRTPFSLLNAKFALSDGVAEIETLVLGGPDFAADVSGSVDMLRQRLEAQASLSLDGRIARMAIEGPWAKPTIVGGNTVSQPAKQGSRITDKEPGEQAPAANP